MKEAKKEPIKKEDDGMELDSEGDESEKNDETDDEDIEVPKDL